MLKKFIYIIICEWHFIDDDVKNVEVKYRSYCCHFLKFLHVHFIATKVKVVRFFRIGKPPRFCNFNFFTKIHHLESSKSSDWRKAFLVFVFNEILSFPCCNINMCKVDKRNTRKRCEICSKLTIKTLEKRHWRRFGALIPIVD